eukprot:362121-Chlamydomonas_euryale.AAC.1
MPVTCGRHDRAVWRPPCGDVCGAPAAGRDGSAHGSHGSVARARTGGQAVQQPRVCGRDGSGTQNRRRTCCLTLFRKPSTSTPFMRPCCCPPPSRKPFPFNPFDDTCPTQRGLAAAAALSQTLSLQPFR